MVDQFPSVRSNESDRQFQKGKQVSIYRVIFNVGRQDITLLPRIYRYEAEEFSKFRVAGKHKRIILIRLQKRNEACLHV